MSRAKSRIVSRILAVGLAGYLTAGAACASAGRLGAAAGPDISAARVLAALILCLVIAFFAILLIRQRSGKIDLRSFFRRADFGSRLIQIVETRRLSQHADICLVRYDGGEYLLLLQVGQSRVLAAKPTATAAGDEAGWPCG